MLSVFFIIFPHYCWIFSGFLCGKVEMLIQQKENLDFVQRDATQLLHHFYLNGN